MHSKPNRNSFFDNAKFILIYLVVLGHLISPLKSENNVLFKLYTFIYLFHMPAFIFISGYFSKGFEKKGYLAKIIKKVLLPYLIFQFIYSIFYYLNGQEGTLNFDFYHPHWSLWFLLSLFFWNLLLYLFSRLRWGGLVLAVLIGVGIGYVENVGSYLSLSRTFVFFPYFLLGFLLNGHQLKLLIRGKYSIISSIVILIAALLFFNFEFPKDGVAWLLGDSSYREMDASYLSAGMIRGIQYIGTLIVIWSFLVLIPAKQFILTRVGERTLYVYLLHGFIIKSFIGLLPVEIRYFVSDKYLLLMMLALIICLLLGNYLTKKYAKPIVELRLN